MAPQSGGSRTKVNCARLILRQKFFQIPHLICDSRLHRRSDPNGAVNPEEVVVGEVKRQGHFQVLPLLAEPVR